MNKTTKNLSAMLFVVLVVPQVVLASWWNPFSWFDFLFSSKVKVSAPFTPVNHAVSTSTKSDIQEVKKDNLNVNTGTQNEYPKIVTPVVAPQLQVVVPPTVSQPVNVQSVIQPTKQEISPVEVDSGPRTIIESLSNISRFCYDRIPSACITDLNNKLSVFKVTPDILTLVDNNWNGLHVITITGKNLGANGATIVYYDFDGLCNLNTRMMDNFNQTPYIDVSGCRVAKITSNDNQTAYFSVPAFTKFNDGVSSGTGDYLTFIIASQSDFGSKNTTGYARFNIPIIKK